MGPDRSRTRGTVHARVMPPDIPRPCRDLPPGAPCPTPDFCICNEDVTTGPHIVKWLVVAVMIAMIAVSLIAIFTAAERAYGADNLPPCYSISQARAKYPNIHLWWHYDDDGRRCWSNRRGGPRRHMDPTEPKPASLKSVRWYPREFEQTTPIAPPMLIVVPETDECCWPPLSEFDKRWIGEQ